MSPPHRSHAVVTINGIEHDIEIDPATLLVHFLRDDLGLTGTHVGCETSSCGTCTVILDGDAVKSCTLLAIQADGARVTTVEGLNTAGSRQLATAFLAERGFQCGYCTSGMIMSAAALLGREPSPSGQAIRQALEGNLCRCTGYDTIVLAIGSAAAALRGEAPPEPEQPQPLPRGGYVSRGL